MAVGTTDLDTYLGLGGSIDTARASQIIGFATDACLSIVDPLPLGSDGVVIDVAARAYTNPTNAQTGAAAPFTPGLLPPMGGLWLTKANLAMLRRLSGGAASGAFTIDPLAVDAGPYGYWYQIPETRDDTFSSVEWPGDWDQIPV